MRMRLVSPIGVGVLPTGCAFAPPTPTRSPPSGGMATPAPRPKVGAGDSGAAGLARFKPDQQTAAATSVAAGHRRKAALYRKAVVLLWPDDAQARSEVEKVLAQSPTRADAADALRAIESECVTRQHQGQLASFPLTSRCTASASLQAASSRARRGREPHRNAIECVTLVAEQGELDDARELPISLVIAPGTNPGARSLLTARCLLRAKAPASPERPGAIWALQRILQGCGHKPKRADCCSSGSPTVSRRGNHRHECPGR